MISRNLIIYLFIDVVKKGKAIYALASCFELSCILEWIGSKTISVLFNLAARCAKIWNVQKCKCKWFGMDMPWTRCNRPYFGTSMSNMPVISKRPISDVLEIIGPLDMSTKSPSLYTVSVFDSPDDDIIDGICSSLNLKFQHRKTKRLNNKQPNSVSLSFMIA